MALITLHSRPIIYLQAQFLLSFVSTQRGRKGKGKKKKSIKCHKVRQKLRRSGRRCLHRDLKHPEIHQIMDLAFSSSRMDPNRVRIPGVDAAKQCRSQRSRLKAGIPAAIPLFQLKYVDRMDLNTNLNCPESGCKHQLQIKAKGITGDVLSFFPLPELLLLI